MIFILTQLGSLTAILFVFYLVTWFRPTDSPWSPWWSTSMEKSRRLCQLAKVDKKDIFYELGSGTGTTVSMAAREFGAKSIGIESSKSRVFWSKVKAKRLGIEKNVTFLQKNFFTVDLSPATVVYLYLIPPVIEKLKPKLLKELKSGTTIISNVYPIDFLPLVTKDQKQQLYVYKIPPKK